MAEIINVLNGTNLTRDFGIQSGISAALVEGVRKNYFNELEVTTNSVNTGMAFIEVTRTTVTPNETFLVPFWNTAAKVIDTSGNGYVIIRIDLDAINDGSSNAEDGSGIATIEVVTSLPSDPYLILATLSSGVITDSRVWSQISEYVLDDPVYYDEDAEANDDYVISINGVYEYKDGKEYTFKANTQNTGTATLSINGLPAKAIKKKADTDLDSNDIKAGQICTVRYDADNDWFQLMTTPSTITSLSKASVGEAITGTDPDKYMTPETTKAAIDANAGSIIQAFELGENVSGTDITNKQNLVYLDVDGTWKKVTSSATTQEGRKLAIVTEAGVIGDSVNMLLKGKVEGMSFSAIAPSDFEVTTGSNNQDIGTSSAYPQNRARAVPLTNAGPECEIGGSCTIRVKKTGNPSSNFYIAVVLAKSGHPFFWWDGSSHEIGAIVAETSIAQATINNTYSDQAFTLPTIRIPARYTAYLVVWSNSTDSSNYYTVECSTNAGLVLKLSSNSGSPYYWESVTNGEFKYHIPTISINPWEEGFSVVAYDNANGSYGVAGENYTSSGVVYRSIGKMLSATEFYFDPDGEDEMSGYFDDVWQWSGNNEIYQKIDTYFRPSRVDLDIELNYTISGNTFYSASQRGAATRTTGHVPEGICVSLGNGSAQTATSLTTGDLKCGLGSISNYEYYVIPLEKGFYFTSFLKDDQTSDEIDGGVGSLTARSIVCYWKAKGV